MVATGGMCIVGILAWVLIRRRKAASQQTQPEPQKADVHEFDDGMAPPVCCPSCGQDLPGDSRFCENCGARIGKAAQAKRVDRVEAIRKRLKGLGISGCMLLFMIPSVAVLVGVWFLSNWFYSRDIWILGAICRVFCWIGGIGLAFTLLGVIGMALYSLIKGDVD